ncbi:MAG: hypothetical protein HY238_08120 [Acidobacteria bacterium]|nr:hypothetical protein [Acidobacteriota bacterium]
MRSHLIAVTLIAFCLGGSAIAQNVTPRELYVHVFMHHYVGGGGFYPSAQDLRAFAELTQKYHVPATFFFDGILVERLQEEDPAIFEYLNGIKAPLGYHAEETHGPFPVATNLLGGRLPGLPPSGSASSVTYGRPWNEAVEAVIQRYSHRIVPGPINPDTKQMNMRQGGQLSGFLLEQPSVPTVGVGGAVMRGTSPELIEQGLSIAGPGNDFFWFMNRLNYKIRRHPAGNLPFRFLEVGLVAWPPRGMAGVEEQLQQLVAEVKAVPGSRFITPGELAGLFEPQNARSAEKDELRRIADKLIAGWVGRPPDFVDVGARSYSLADAYEALATALAQYGAKGTFPERVRATGLYGPIAEPGEIRSCKVGKLPAAAVCAAASIALEEAGRLNPRRVPIITRVGEVELNAAEFLLAMSRVYRALAGSMPATVDVEPSSTVPPYADVIERLFQPGDSRPLWYSKLQLWTVKPASLKTPSSVQPSSPGNLQGAR